MSDMIFSGDTLLTKYQTQHWNYPLNHRPRKRFLVTWLFVLFALNVSAATVEGILVQQQPPDGVVFEIIEGSEKDLNWAIPRIREDTKRLSVKFPGLSIAVVSHVMEEFGLTREEAEKRPEVHQTVKDLSATISMCQYKSVPPKPPVTTHQPKSFQTIFRSLNPDRRK
jgi:hypothetical protein